MPRPKLEIKYAHLYEEMNLEEMTQLQKELEREIKKKNKAANSADLEKKAIKLRNSMKIGDTVVFKLKSDEITAEAVAIFPDKVKVSWTEGDKVKNKAIPFTKLV